MEKKIVENCGEIPLSRTFLHDWPPTPSRKQSGQKEARIIPAITTDVVASARGAQPSLGTTFGEGHPEARRILPSTTRLAARPESCPPAPRNENPADSYGLRRVIKLSHIVTTMQRCKKVATHSQKQVASGCVRGFSCWWWCLVKDSPTRPKGTNADVGKSKLSPPPRPIHAFPRPTG